MNSMTSDAMRTLLQRTEQLIDANNDAEEDSKINKCGDAIPNTRDAIPLPSESRARHHEREPSESQRRQIGLSTTRCFFAFAW